MEAPCWSISQTNQPPIYVLVVQILSCVSSHRPQLLKVTIHFWSSNLRPLCSLLSPYAQRAHAGSNEWHFWEILLIIISICDVKQSLTDIAQLCLCLSLSLSWGLFTSGPSHGGEKTLLSPPLTHHDISLQTRHEHGCAASQSLSNEQRWYPSC